VIVAGLLAIYAALISAATYFTFRHDKLQALTGGWRVSENTLLFLALAGGGMGAKLAQRHFRHKTRKQPFGLMLNLFSVIGMGALVALAAHPLGHRMIAASAGQISQKPGETSGPQSLQPRVVRRGQGSSF
jgi:uncharacterized membrane protein YsdA (DUF1294 family)